MAQISGPEDQVGQDVLVGRTRDRLQLVIDSSIRFASATDEASVAEHLASTVERAYGAIGSLVLVVDERHVLGRAAGENPFEGLVREPVFRDLSFLGPGVLTVTGADEARGLHPALGEALEASPVEAMLIAPLRHQGTELGAVACFFGHARRFDSEAAPLAVALAGQAAQTIANLRMRRMLEHAAQHDPITELPNRRLLEDQLELTNHSDYLAVLFIDLDNFKAVNDRCGHLMGDQVLRDVAGRLRESVREGDLIARFGGDEFVVVCEVAEPDLATEIGERLRRSIREPYSYLPEDLAMGASVGLALAKRGETDIRIEQLIRVADQFMYRAKAEGGDRVAASV